MPRGNIWTHLLHDLGWKFEANSFMRRKFFLSTLNYKDRALFAAFIVQNGLDPYLICEVLRFTNKNVTEKRLDKIILVVQWLHANPHRYKDYYAFDIQSGRVLTLDKKVRSVNSNE